MTVNQAGIDLVKHFEGCSLVAYPDGAGIQTIGWGHTQGVKEGDTCSQEQADAWLMENIESAAAGVSAVIDVPLNENQFAALVSFTFNLGIGSLRGSTLRKLINSGQTALAASEFLKWDKVAGKPSPGLQRRRQAEMDLFLSVPEVVT